MCTVSWQRDTDGYRLLCNRDERRTRRAAIEPHAERRHGVHFLAPVDGEYGGTWLSVNEYGLGLCLLNGACVSDAICGVGGRTRGAIPLALADACSGRVVFERLLTMDLAPYAAFTLVILEPDLPAALAEWNGAELALIPYGDPYLPLISSSVDPVGVRARRREVFGGDLEAFHRSHADGLSAYSPCMHRDDAETVSFSEVRVNAESVELRYSAGSPCRGIPPVVRSLVRVQ
jgi:hypothetical protein